MFRLFIATLLLLFTSCCMPIKQIKMKHLANKARNNNWEWGSGLNGDIKLDSITNSMRLPQN